MAKKYEEHTTINIQNGQSEDVFLKYLPCMLLHALIKNLYFMKFEFSLILFVHCV